ncbi:MAG: class I SAM-dependent methyltransferase [Planctomycetaceae bacterium]
MKEDYGGQRSNMEDLSMVGTLASQATVVWPKEREILRRRVGPWPRRILDLACGTGEALARIRGEGGGGLAVGVDLFRGHLRRAAPPVAQADARRLPFADATFDLVLNRHMLQAVPDPLSFLLEARRILRPGGRIHLLVEDYSAILFDTLVPGDAELLRDVAPRFLPRGTDLHQGRKALRQLRAAGFSRITVDPFVVDNQGEDRETFAAIFRFWRDGYVGTLAELLGVAEAEARGRFDGMIAAALDPGRWCGWMLLAVGALR